jgi:hypothetical protein
LNILPELGSRELKKETIVACYLKDIFDDLNKEDTKNKNLSIQVNHKLIDFIFSYFLIHMISFLS